MVEQSDLADKRNDPRAQNVVRAVERFVRVFKERGGDHAADVMLGDSELEGEEINQEPERFIEDNLIEPVADALNLNIRFRPRGFEGLGDRIPDFTALNLGVENFGEVKPPGGINTARAESVEYVSMATERPIACIATDGLTWILYTAEEGENPAYTSHKRIDEIIQKLRKEQSYERADLRSRPRLRKEAYELASEFSKSAIEGRFDS